MPIVEQGYQHWSGRLSGHTWRWLTVARQGVRIQFRNRFLRYLLFAAWTPAFLLVCALSIWGLLERKSKAMSTIIAFLRFMNPHVIRQPQYYSSEIWILVYGYFMHVELMFSMILVLVVGPGLISQDLRVNALPLYFSRPLRRIDYFVGKWAVIGFFIGMVTILPTIVAYLFGALFSLNWTTVINGLPIALSAIAYGLVICICAGTLMLALSGLSRNLRYIALLWLGVWFISSVMSAVLAESHNGALRSEYFHKVSQHPVVRLANPNTGAVPVVQGPGYWRKAWRHFEVYQWRADHHDWRPLLSFTGDLSRVGDHLLGTNDAWKKFAALEPAQRQRIRLLIHFGGPWYPWYWSAAVLVGLWVISVGILRWSVRSLDRLK